MHINPLTADAIGVSKAAPTSDVRVDPNDAGRAVGDALAMTTEVTARTPDGGVEPRGSNALSDDLVHRRAERHHAAERSPHGPPTAKLPPSELHINPLMSDAAVVSKTAPTSGDRVEPNEAGRAVADAPATTTEATPRTPDGGAEPLDSTALSDDVVHRRADRHHAASPAALAS